MIRAALAFLVGAAAGALAVAWVVAPTRRYVDRRIEAPYKIDPPIHYFTDQEWRAQHEQ